MALTMTRTRTQTALTKLAERVAAVHGELEHLEEVLTKEMPADKRALVEARRAQLVSDRDALYLTIRQFDSSLSPELILPQRATPKKIKADNKPAFVLNHPRPATLSGKRTCASQVE